MALGVALTLALGSVSNALAKASTHVAPSVHTVALSHTTPAPVPVRTVAKNVPVAHAAGHKIA
ncbi:MAG TPA: hypothetical protein VMF57_05185 [Solirubrobacteraceae bacterium]|nr:hypothetical protein [Solirubrobacteraceae bacterium]